mgnify:CR=1 FL=1
MGVRFFEMKEQRNKPQDKNDFKWIRRSYFASWMFMGCLSMYFWLFVEDPAHKLDFGVAWREGIPTGNWIFTIFFFGLYPIFFYINGGKGGASSQEIPLGD